MKKITNPWTVLDDYNCFACSPNNPAGIQMEFYEDGDEVVSTWQPTKNYEGFTNVLHGGIQATLLDEMGAWIVARKLQTIGVTSRLNIRYHKAVDIRQTHITIRAKITEVKRNLAFIEAKIYNVENEVCASAEMCYFCTPKEQAAHEFHFTGCKTEEE